MNTTEMRRATRFFFSAVAFTGFVVFFPVAAQRALAQGELCDTGILHLAGSGKLAYQNLGARCEGTFANPSGGAADLNLVSLSSSFPLMNFSDSPSLSVSWAAFPPADVRLRAVSTRYKFYYQMDAHPGAADTFSWPTDRLAASGLLRPEVGILASAARTIAGKTEVLLFPVAVQAKGTPPSSQQAIEGVLVPTARLNEVFRTITEYTEAGVRQAVLLSNRPLQYGDYQAHQRIVFPLDLGTGTGLFRLDVMATISDGGTLKKSYWIHAGPTR